MDIIQLGALTSDCAWWKKGRENNSFPTTPPPKIYTPPTQDFIAPGVLNLGALLTPTTPPRGWQQSD